MKRLVLFALFPVFLTSCATKMLMQEVKDGERLVINEYVSNVNKAIITPDTGQLLICLEITSLNSNGKRLVTMIVPPDKGSDSDINGRNGSRFVKVNLKDEPVSNCDFSGKELPIIFIRNNHNVNKLVGEFDFNQKSAIYALEADYSGVNKMIANIGHLNLRSNSRGFEFRQFLYNHELYEKTIVEGNPWMLAFLPLAIVADVFLVLVSEGRYLWEEPEDKYMLWKKNMPNQPVQEDIYKRVDWEEVSN